MIWKACREVLMDAEYVFPFPGAGTRKYIYPVLRTVYYKGCLFLYIIIFFIIEDFESACICSYKIMCSIQFAVLIKLYVPFSFCLGYLQPFQFNFCLQLEQENAGKE